MYKNETLIALLSDVRSGLTEENVTLVDEVLQEFQDDTPPSTPTLPTRSSEKRPRTGPDDKGADARSPDNGRTHNPAGVNGRVDEFDEYIPADQGASSSVGYLGRNSQVQWMRTLQHKLEGSQHEPLDSSRAYWVASDEANPRRAHPPRGLLHGPTSAQSLGECYFYLDNTPLDKLDDIEPDLAPPLDAAYQLFQFYQKAVHTPFFILDGRFEEQLGIYYDMLQRGTATNICPRWKATINLVFAIGSHFSHLVGATWQTGIDDHQVYMSRAVHLLGFNKIANFAGPPNQSLIQATGLLSLYFLVTGHVNSAWNMIGISLRHAQAAGFHLEIEDPAITDMDKRQVARIWGALHSIECILTSITGRPRIIDPQDCTVSLLSGTNTKKSSDKATSTQTRPGHHAARSRPAHDIEERTHMTTNQCLEAWARLDLIQHNILSSLYSVRSVGRSWKYIEAHIQSFITEMEEWAQDSLVFADRSNPMAEVSNRTRENVLLFFYYQSARICVTRPCLCRLDRRIDDPDRSHRNFVQDMADACIQAALDIASGLPKHISYKWVYEMGPWWSIIHIMMQAITVLLLELMQRTSRLSSDPFYILACVEHLVQWLKALKSVDRVAENAFSLVCEMLRKYKRFAQDTVPEQWLADETALPEHHDANMFAEKSTSATDSMSDQQFMPQNNPFSFQTSQDVYGSGSEGLSLTSNTLDDAFGGFQFGQVQYTPLYSSQFTTLFDQEMGDGAEDTPDGWG